MNTQDQSPPSRTLTQSAKVTPARRKRTPISRSRRFAQAIAVAARYRHFVTRGRSILFYGTKHPRSIIRDDSIKAYDPLGYPVVSFTRSFHVAVHFAMLYRDDEETTGAIFFLDRELLRNNYSLEPHHDPVFDNWYNDHSATEDEESIVVGAIPDLKRYLLGVVGLQENERYLVPKRRSGNDRRAPRSTICCS